MTSWRARPYPQAADTKTQRRRRTRHCSWGRWPRFSPLAPSHIPQNTDPKPPPRIRSTATMTFGAATGVSDPRLQNIRIRNNGAGGEAATVAGVAGPGFHNWPQATSLKTQIRNRLHESGPLLKRRSEKRSVRRSATRSRPFFPSPTGRLRGQRPPLQKIPIRNDDAGGEATTVAGVAGPGFHNWPAGHILREADAKAVIRIRRIRTCPEGVR